jgi:hypothetical protein
MLTPTLSPLTAKPSFAEPSPSSIAGTTNILALRLASVLARRKKKSPPFSHGLKTSRGKDLRPAPFLL